MIDGEIVKQDEIILEPKDFVLASTIEQIHLPNNIAAVVMGRSSFGRKGLFVQNAGFIDPGFNGEITLELFNASNKRLVVSAGTKIAQLIFIGLKENSKGYTGRYQNQRGATNSRICPECGSDHVVYFASTNSASCNNCKHQWKYE